MRDDRHGRPGQQRPARQPPLQGPAPARAAPGRHAPGRRAAGRRRGVAVIAAVAGVGALAAGIVVGSNHVPEEIRIAERFAAAWTAGDTARMYAELSADARARVTAARFAELYAQAGETATTRTLTAGAPVALGEGRVEIPVHVNTRIFGTVRAPLQLEVVGDGEARGIDWRRHHIFPGMRLGEELSRETVMPPRADILARDKTPLARGEDRSSPVPDVAINVVGRVGPAPPERADELRERGWPPEAVVGLTGLERALDTELAGRPGGTLRAGSRVLARAEPRAAEPVRTTISIPVERAAVQSLAGRLGGIVAITPRTGELIAFAGIAFSGLQPPGSTMKIITLVGGLEKGITDVDETYPVATETRLEGVSLENANGESCGGTLEYSFAHSCNSVFAPMGAELGADALVDVAERFGFNQPPDILGAATPTIPAADEIGDDLAVGSTAIGQGRVQANALTMGLVAATIARRGARPELTLLYDPDQEPAPTTRVTSPEIARTVGRMMVAVVRDGTGTLAAIPGVDVAGKTGTAELTTTRRCVAAQDNPETCVEESDETDTSAWFASYAPAGDAKVAVGVLLVRSGSGGDNAAPVARQVMAAALGK